jgi:myo-inositol 2-dehydrogenase / D-chiro-inositol 1-dehydrogenase
MRSDRRDGRGVGLSDRRVRLAVVGAGRMGSVHLDALRSAERAVPVAVVEPHAPARDAAGAGGLATYADVDELLAAGGFDAVLIAAPSDLHVALVARFVAARVPVLCEKPCGLRADETRAAAAPAAAAGVLLQIGYWRRFVPELVDLRERITAGDLGEVLRVACWQWDAAPPAPSFRAHSGGIAIDMGVHELDQTRWLTGQEIDELDAVPASLSSARPVDGDPDSVEAVARLSRGSVAAISLGRRFPHGDCCWVEVMGTKGYARVDFMWGEVGEKVFRQAMTAQADAFAETVRGGPTRGASADDAVRALEAAERMSTAIARRLA